MSSDISFNNLTPYARLLLQPASNNIFQNSSQYQLESIFSLLRNRTNTPTLLNSNNIRTYPQIINNINDQSNVRISPVDSEWGDFLTNFILHQYGFYYFVCFWIKGRALGAQHKRMTKHDKIWKNDLSG